jgi:predicted Zn finger-like uncharacterized protein
MALATQCPHCHTTFRVAHDQLKLRAGLVRCGACKQIFNGIENLLRPEEMEQAASWTIPSPPSPPTPQAESRAPDAPSSSVAAEEAGISAEQEQDESIEANTSYTPSAVLDTEPATEDNTPKDDPLLRMTLMDFTHEQRGRLDDDDAEPAPVDADESDPIEQAIDDLERKPWRSEQEATQAEADALDQADAAGYEEPSFVRQGRRKQRIGRALRMVMSVGSVILLLTLLAQGTYVFRDQIAAWFPRTKPILAEVCARMGCQVGLPAQIEAVSIESSELQTLAADANTFTLTILLRNHGATEQAWPHIELTLNDANEKALARRVFTPREYLPPPQDAKKGFAARSEQSVKLYFELAQLKASGYRVYLFYP